MKDGEAKRILGSKWPSRTEKWPIPGYKGFWLRGCPSPGATSMPYLKVPGAQILTTRPDGLYIFAHVDLGFADLIAIEHCGKNQNLNDKRSRYTGQNTRLVLPHDWLTHSIKLRGRGGKVERIWKASGWFQRMPTSDVELTVRQLRVLFALKKTDFNAFGLNQIPAGHEYFCRHEQLDQISSPAMQNFVKGLATMKHFASRPK